MGARWPDDIAFTVMSKRAGAQKWTMENTFIVDRVNGYEEGMARLDAENLLVELYTNHTGGEADYMYMRCVLQGWETRPVV